MMPYLTVSPLVVAYALFIAALLGLVMGSFINCWAWRYMNGESVLKGRSHCTSCGHELGLRDLVPVFSWLVSGGKCRYCGERVSARYPATELVCAIVFVAIVTVYGLTLQTVELLAFAGILLFLSLTDLDGYLIPNGCIISAIVIRVVYLGVTFALGETTTDQIIYYAASGIGIGIALVIVVLIADFVFGRSSMGGGDLKLYFVAGLYFGWQQCLLLVILSCLFGIIVALTGRREPARAETAKLAESAGGDSSADTPKDDALPANASSNDHSARHHVEGEGVEGGPETVSADKRVELEPEEGSVQNERAPEVPEMQPERSAEAARGDALGAESDSSPAEESVMKRTIPFGPSIAAACVVVMLVGEPIINWYSSLL